MSNGSPPHPGKKKFGNGDLWTASTARSGAVTVLGDSEVCHLRGHVSPVLVVQVPVDLADEHAAVSVAHPSRDGQEVHAPSLATQTGFACRTALIFDRADFATEISWAVRTNLTSEPEGIINPFPTYRNSTLSFSADTNVRERTITLQTKDLLNADFTCEMFITIRRI